MPNRFLECVKIVAVPLAFLSYFFQGELLCAHPEAPSSNPVKYLLDDIEFEFKTTQSFDDDDLLDIMILPKKKNFLPEDLDEDRERIKKFYFDNGFFDAVVDTSTAFDAEDESVLVNIIIIENDRYKIDKLKYSGLDNIAPELKSKIFEGKPVKPGDYYSKALILSETSRMLDFLLDNGYFYARLDSIDGTVISKFLTNDPDLKNRVIVQLTFIGTSRQYGFGKISVNIIDNKYRLQEHLIKRELEFEEGKLYSKEKVIQSERNFNKFSIIKSGRIEVDTVLETEGRVNLAVKITLTNKYEVTPKIFGVDIDNQFFLGAGIEYQDRNFFGGGRVFSVDLEGYAHSNTVNIGEISSTLYQPYLFNNRITATYNLRFGIYNIDKSLQAITLRNLLRLSYYIAYYTFYNNAYSDITVDLIRLKYREDLISNGDTNRAGSISNLMNSIIGLTLVHDNTNDFFNPSAGFYHSITAENAGLFPRFMNLINRNIDFSQYVKFYTINKFYYDISGRRATSIFAFYNEIGDIIEYGKGDYIVPVAPLYKFISGGSSSLRGWNAKEGGILRTPEDGGKFLFEGSFEYRWRSFSRNQNFLKNIWTVYFIDYGNVWERHKLFKLSEIALAIGIGIRYETFIGPLRVDFGFKLYNPTAKENNKWLFDNFSRLFKDRKFAFQFGLGNAF